MRIGQLLAVARQNKRSGYFFLFFFSLDRDLLAFLGFHEHRFECVGYEIFA